MKKLMAPMVVLACVGLATPALAGGYGHRGHSGPVVKVGLGAAVKLLGVKAGAKAGVKINLGGLLCLGR
jgi:hypothetical protein